MLPILDILWQAAVDNKGISNIVNTSVLRPNACSSVNY